VDRENGGAGDVLVVVYEQVSYTARPGSEVTFGRGTKASVRIGVDDPFMHRRAGSFRWEDGRWELHNDGARCMLEVDVDGGFQARISAGADPLILPAGAYGSVRVLTPILRTLSFATSPKPRTGSFPNEEDDGDEISELSTVGLREMLGLNPLETRMLVALCEPRLRNPRLKAYVVPSTSELCERLDVVPKKVEDLVDSLATKMAQHIGGVIGSNDGRAITRRHRIAAFALDTRCVTVSDLRLLDRPVLPIPPRDQTIESISGEDREGISTENMTTTTGRTQ